jgi:hypothetical protein
MKLDWKWLIALAITVGGIVIGAAGSAAVLSYRVNEHEKAVMALTEQMKVLERSVQELNITLRLKGVM